MYTVKALGMSQLSQDQQSAVIAALCEGVSIRATERLTGIHRDAIMPATGEHEDRLAITRDFSQAHAVFDAEIRRIPHMIIQMSCGGVVNRTYRPGCGVS